MCILHCHQVGLMLRGMGFDNTTSIYLASGEIYNSDTYMDPLLEMFPLLQTKETLASEMELAPFKVWEVIITVPFCICYISCFDSDVLFSRISLQGWLLLIILFVFIAKCLWQLRGVTSLSLCWAIEDIFLVDTQKQSGLTRGS